MRTYYVDDPYHWATTGTPAELDVLSLNAAGHDYATRNEPSGRSGQSGETAATGEPRQAGGAKEAILAVLAERGETQRGELIATTGYSPRAVTDACKALVDDNRIRKTDHGRYALTEHDTA